ncbi:site-specific integrase [Ruminococcus sp.]|uniref:tyrosine-type recombinase/integrase n=1 Tax=Ruminococcus sp. TaxID=41978 RepID=UPI0025E6546A|nr:site-specific integrase [Ruminococcus sp.]MCR4639045.1 site-specific integrase [Ruminococcus sp.]
MPRKGENIYKRRDGRWEGRYKTGYNEHGKAKYHSVYGHSYTEVKEKLLPMKAAPAAIAAASCNMTVKELFDEWLAAVKLRVKSSTYANYTMKVKKHILPAFGGLRYDVLTVQMIHSFIDNKLNEGLSPKYVSDVIVVFKAMAKYTSKVHGYRNILADVVMPKYIKEEKPLLTLIQQRILCKYLFSNLTPTTLCLLLSYYTGLRVGEVCGMMWDDIDFEKEVLTVRRTVQRINNGSSGTQLIIDTPKSRSSQRTIPIPTFLMKLLRESRSNNNHYILSNSERIIEPRTLQRRFQTILKKAGLPSVNYHCLRHMFATNSLQAGFDVKTLSEILGHSSVETTLNRYVHSSMERKRACMELIKITA